MATNPLAALAAKHKKPRPDVIKSQGGIPSQTPEAIQAQLNEAKAQKLAVLDQLRRHKESHLLEAFVPTPKQQLFFDALQDHTLKTFVLLGANRSGKTESAVAAALSLATGRYPWTPKPQGTDRSNPTGIRVAADGIFVTYPDGTFRFSDNKAFKEWQQAQVNPPDPGALRWPGPIKIRVLAEDMTALEQVQLPKFRKLCAPEWIAAKKKNSFGLDVHWVFTNGSVVDFLTYQQETAMMEGWDGHVVIYDEPPPRDKYIANLRGLVDHGGISIFAMTPLKEPWIADEIVNKPDSTIWTMTMTWRDNPHISKQDYDTFAEALTPDEKETRLEGKFLHLQGLVFKDFKIATHVVTCREPPKDSTVYVAIDTHPRTEMALVFVWVDRKNNVFQCHEVFKHGTPDNVADWVIDFNDDVHKLELALIDPSSQGDKNRGDTTYDIIANRLADAGIPLEFGSKDLSSGIQIMQEAFKSRNGIASLFIDPSCKRTIWELGRYVWKDWKNAGGTEKGELNKPRDADDHCIENLRRLIQLPAEYRSPRQAQDFARQNRWQPSDSDAGY